MHPVIASISVRFLGVVEDIGISKRRTGHFRIFYRSRDICLDCGSLISISDRNVKKIIFNETIIYKMIQLEYSVDFTSYGACKSVFERHRVDLRSCATGLLFHKFDVTDSSR